ncbi:MAG: hypothetical protein ACQKBV_06635, partial [Puniceicoccales bacterium]
VFFDPEEIYVWDMAFGQDGNLYVATGAKANIYQLTPDHQLNDEVTPYFTSDRTHFTRMTWDTDGALIIGSGPDAYLYRVTAEKEGEVLYSAGTDEIANVAVIGEDIFFSTWHKKSGNGNPPENLAKLLAKFLDNGKADGDKDDSSGGDPAPASAPSFLLKLDADGFVSPVWSPGGSNLQFMTPTSDGAFLVGSDNDGRLYSVTSADEWSLLNEAPRGGEITVILTDVGAEKKRYVFTSNPAAVYELVDSPAEKPLFTGKPLDASTVARWGSLRPLGMPTKSAGLAIETRSGNAAEPDDTWSKWTALDEGRVTSPPARFLQYRVGFEQADATLRGLTAYYGARNLAPLVSTINIIPAGLNIVTNVSANPKTINAKELAAAAKTTAALSKPAPENEKIVVAEETGAISVAWRAIDPNGDQLRYNVALKPEGEADWITMADDLPNEAFSTPTRGLPDGFYAFRITANDAPSNLPSETRSGFLVSQPFLIDNTSPAVKLHNQTTGDNGETILVFNATDEWGVIVSANYRLDGKSPVDAIPTDLLFDSTDEVFRLTFPGLKPGHHSIVFEAVDERGNRGLAKSVFTVE